MPTSKCTLPDFFSFLNHPQLVRCGYKTGTGTGIVIFKQEHKLTTMDELMFATIMVLLITCPSTGKGYNRKPNFVIFLADDMGFADLQVYGNPLSYTPNINLLARNGMKFTQFYSASSVDSPSRAGLLTGRYPVRSGVWGNISASFNQGFTGGLPHEEVTIAEMLAKQGYESAHVGKWHLGVGYDKEFLPLQQGFDRYFGVPYTHSDCPCKKCFYPDDSCDFNHCADHRAPCQLMYGNTILEQPVDLIALAERQARAARSWIQEYSCSKTPFFLFYSFQHTQVPHFAGKQFRHSTIGGEYTDSLAELDWQVGEVLDELEKNGLRENTMIIFTSDNGPALEQGINGGFSGPMRCGKGSTFEGGHRVPTIVNWPGHVSSGISRKFLSHLDIWPTIRRLSGSSADEFDVVLDGFDFSDVLFKNHKSERSSMLYYPVLPEPNVGPVGIRDVKYKILIANCSDMCWNSNGETICVQEEVDKFIMFDLLLDPQERYEIGIAKEQILSNLIAKMEQEASEIEFGKSVLMDFDASSQLCCDPGCEPFPACCSCESNYKDELFPLDAQCTHAQQCT